MANPLYRGDYHASGGSEIGVYLGYPGLGKRHSVGSSSHLVRLLIQIEVAIGIKTHNPSAVSGTANMANT